MYEDRFVRVESQVVEVKSQVVEVKAQLSYVVMTQQRHDTLLEALTTQSTLLGNQSAVQAQVAKAIEARTDEHSKEIVSLQAGLVDIGKVMAAHSSDIGSIKKFGGAGISVVASLIVGYLLSHFTK